MSGNGPARVRDRWAASVENVYAHGKRLDFIVRAVEAWRERRGRGVEETAVLDVGCGTGIMVTLPLASLGYRVVGIDPDGPSVETARRANPYPNAAFRRMEPAGLSADETRYDVVIASEVLEHVAEPVRFLGQLRDLLAPGGILVLSVPNGYGWFELEQYLWERLGLGRLVLAWHERWVRLGQRLKAPVKRLIGWRPRPVPPPPPWEYLTSTNNAASPHLQRFGWGRLCSTVEAAGWRRVAVGQSGLFCGQLSHFYLRNRRALIAVNAGIGDWLPRRLAAGWYLVCEAGRPVPAVACLCDSGVKAQAVARLSAELGGPPAVALSFREMRQRPSLALGLPLHRFDAAIAFLADVEAPLYRDFILTYLCLLRARRKALRDLAGREVAVGLSQGLGALGRCLGDLVRGPLVYLAARRQAGRLLLRRPVRRVAPRARPVAYLRANLWQESQAGGAVAHTAGVLGGLTAAGLAVTYLGTAEFPPARRLGLPALVVPPERMPVRNLPDLPFVAYGALFTRRAAELLRTRPPGFIYQRYSLLNLSGAALARRLGCPLVLEYNGSEVWIARHWSTPLLFEGLAGRIEAANLAAADLVVVVSKALRDQVTGRGIPPERVLVNPNGVDPDRYHPGLDGAPVRRRLGLEGKLVIGFIGTFGPWHGAEVLARAVKEVAERLPAAHFLLVGDGSGMPRVKEIVTRDGVGERVTFAGLVPQEEAPAYLAACDILASPHVPNPDGSPFFGSPTKLFEYMAMGKGMVASDLDQIGEILRHGETAWLVPPGEPAALAAGLVRLGEEPALRARLGAAAREAAVRRHTWRAHVGRLLDRMEALGLLEPAARGDRGGAA